MMEIYYFSGTGNTLHLGRELQRRIPDTKLIPIISLLKQDKKKIKITAEKVGILFPIFAFTTPQVVEKFLIKADMINADYIFALSSRFCSSKVYNKINKILNEKGKRLSSLFSVESPENYIPIFKTPTKAEIEKLEKRIQYKLDEFADIIINKQDYVEKDGILLSVISNTIFRFFTYLHRKTKFFGMQNKFYVTNECSGCGICEKVCLSGTISLINNKPNWKSNIDCIYCYACIHWCPLHAIQKGKKTENYGRYHHPEIKFSDISKQKEFP